MSEPVPPPDDLRDVLCEDRSGFLFAHPCKRFARVRCARCNRPICEQHRQVIGQSAYCTACAEALGPQSRSLLGDSPYFYGRIHHPYYQSYWLFDDDPDWGSYDFTDADGASTQAEGDQAFESDLGAS